MISYEQIKSVIDKWDPIGLLCTHSPQNEYDSESQVIFMKSQSIINLELNVLAEIIFNTFTEAFGDDVFVCNRNECEAVANRILSKNLI